jgi:polar amino acid transport system ATP-binding protein
MLVRIENVHKSKGGNPILKGVSLSVERGKVVCLLGPSGAGKSTLLRCINAIEPCDSGLVYVDDEPIGCVQKHGQFVRLSEHELARQRMHIGMVFQGFNLFPHMTVLQNIVDAPIRVKKLPRDEAEDIARDLLDKVGLADKADQYPRQLSGGQQQRIAIARALAMKPKLMLFDEPTSSLDPRTTGEVLDVLRTLAASGMTMIVVTHEIDFAREVSDEVAIMADGRIIEQGPSRQVLSNPADPRTRNFLARPIQSISVS